MGGNIRVDEYLERLYSILKWPEDLQTDEGKRRFENSVNSFKKVIKHEWLRELLTKTSVVSVLDVCGGTGVGGIALAKVLSEMGMEVNLTINDLRKSALNKAKIFSKQVLGKEAVILMKDATRLHELNVKYDIALLYGFSTPHFNPFHMIKMISSMGKILKTHGVFLIEETDRIYNIFYLAGYKDILLEYANNEEIVISMHLGHNVNKGTFERLTINLVNMEREKNEVYFWDIAGIAALLWIFFNDVDFIPINGKSRGIIVSKEPRGLNPTHYQQEPRICIKEKYDDRF